MFAATDQLRLSDLEAQELKQWQDRLRPELGKLQSPPIGGGELEPARQYVQTLLDKLAGEDFKVNGMSVRAEVFSGDIPQAGLDDDMYQEELWMEEHPGKPWPIRSWYGVPQNGKPLYRLTLNAGLLRTLKSEDELAFILAQQAARLVEHHKKDPQNEELLAPDGQSVIEPHEMQAGADRDGILKMVKAGYNPVGAMTALNTLYANRPEKYSGDDQVRALQAGAAGHEHEGLRFALVQTQVEDYRRSGDPTVEKPQTALPAGIAPPGPALYEVSVEDFAKFQSAFVELAEQLTGESTPAWMFGEGDRPEQVGEIRRTPASTADYEKALLGTCEALSGKPPQQQVDGVLRLILATRAKMLPEDKPFSPETAVKLQAFFAQPGWSADAFLASLGREATGEGKSSLHRSLVDRLLMNETFQSFGLGALAERAAGCYLIDEKTGLSDVTLLPEFYRKNQDEPECKWAMADRHNYSVRQFVRSLDGDALAQKTDESGLPLGLALSTQLLDTKHQSAEELDALEASLEGVTTAAYGVRENHARLRLRPPLQDAPKVDAYARGLFASEPWQAFSPEFEAQLPALLLDVARVCSGQPGLQAENGEPVALAPGHERRLCALSNDRDVLRTLCRHWDPEQRVPSTSARRGWTTGLAQQLAQLTAAELVADITRPDLSQHVDTLRTTLVEGFQLSEPVDAASTPELQKLLERKEAGEFEPKREDYASYEEYVQAVDAYYERLDKMAQVVEYVAPAEGRLVLSKLAMLGHDVASSQAVAAKLTLADAEALLSGAEKALQRDEVLRDLAEAGGKERVGVDASGFLMDAYLAVENGFDGLEASYNHLDRILELTSGALESRAGTRKKVGNALFARMDKLEDAREWLAKDHVLDALAPAQASALMIKTLALGAGVPELAKQIQSLDEEFKLRLDYPAIYLELRNAVTERAKLQPDTVDTVFPPDERGGIETTSVFTKEMRGLSSLIAISRGRSPQEQIDTVEYLMGRRKTMPAYLESASEEQNFAPITQSLQNLRVSLEESDAMVRVVVANSFLAGPSGLMRTPEGREAIIGHFTKGIPADHLELARKVGNAILVSQGDADTLAVAFMFGQPPAPPKEGQEPGHMDEAAVLSRLFDSYGVPGIKMKQYLAFTSEFGAFKEAFESAQDAAMPLNYFQVLKLIQKRFGDDWPRDFKVERVLGSGSVNIAIKYRNEKTGLNEVVSLGREDIVETTRYDFARFEKFLAALTATPEDKEQFGYILGLLDIIRASVDLEFEKEAVLQVQKAAYKSYQHQIDGWTVRSIDAYQVKNLGLFMEEAKGKTARKTFQQNPALYQQAMRPMAKAEMGILRGQDSRGNLCPKDMFANPDFHDGQVLIDEANKTVTILDFGQAVPISKEERKIALDLMTIIGKGDGPKAAVKRLNRRFFPNGGGVTIDEMKELLKRTERMDCFVHLLSTLSQKGADVSIASVHWILGLNRQIALGEKLGLPVQKQVRNMGITHKIGLNLGVYNMAHAAKEKALDWALSLGRATGLFGLEKPPATPGLDSEKPPSKDSWAWNPADSFFPPKR